MSFPRYPKYKDSGVEWLGEVPEHWAVVPCRAIAREQTAKNEGVSCEAYLSVMANVGVIPYEEKGDVGNKKPEDLSKCKLVSKGDFVINSMNYGIGSYGISAYDGVCSPVYIVLTPRLDVVESRFAYRIFENRAFQTYAQSFGNGILAHRCAINWDILKPIGTPVPPISEQRSILAFLDRETAKIDALIAEQQRLIELLQEKRQAVISHAVTKGLNPDTPTKDSDVVGMEKVPAHWDIKPLKHVVAVDSCGCYGVDPEESEITLPVATTAQIDADGRFAVEEMPVRGFSSAELDRYRCGDGDILVVKSSGSATNIISGKAGYVDAETPLFIFSNFLMRLRPLTHFAAPRFIYWLLRSRLTRQRVEQMCATTTYPNLKVSEYTAAPIPLPPLDEQHVVAGFIDRHVKMSDSLIKEAEHAITLLQERRSALISAAVTGQIDVRGLVGSEAA
jgi:type I restriction enzyme S subunit